MKYIMAKPARLYCNTCDETFALPTANGNIKLHQELKCPLDDFEILYFTAGAKGKVRTRRRLTLLTGTTLMACFSHLTYRVTSSAHTASTTPRSPT